jgi:outer membrane protein assembly factor BamB
LSNCSFNKNSKIWNKKEIQVDNKKNIKKITNEKKIIISELNPNLELNFSAVIYDNIKKEYNNFGFQSFLGKFEKKKVFKFSKHNDNNFLKSKPILIDNGLIYYNGKGSIIRYDNEKKIIWKKNYYSKSEIKSNPKLTFEIKNDKLIVVDNISKLFLIDITDGNLIWKKNSDYPFNSEIKIHKNNFYVVDYLNTLRCFKIKDGSECWNIKTEESFTISDTKNSIVIVNDWIIFNNSIGDITSVDITSGTIAWQTPTQSSKIKDSAYNFKSSQLVSDGEDVFFSNNKGQFYSINIKTGTVNWLNKINSSVTPIIQNNLIFTVSNEGFLYVVQKKKGNIIRINNIYKDYKIKDIKKISPTGLSIGKDFLYITNQNGELIKINLNIFKIEKVENISKGAISKPIIYNKRLYIVKNGSILEYN